MSGAEQVIDELRSMLEQEDDLREVVERSLQEAHDRAQADLDPTLRDALSWPTDLAAYERYLLDFIRWIPRQSDDPAWKVGVSGHRYAKEVSDRLAHFFWLTDQPVCDGEQAVAESFPAFSDWLTSFARHWGEFLDTAESFDADILDSFLRDAPEYTIEDSLLADGSPNQPSGWSTFNQFFARELNPGLRPIADPTDNKTVVSPADCSYQHVFDIGDDSGVPAVTVKQKEYGNITQLLRGSRFADAFTGGTFVHYMLPPSAYHRFHVPVSGRVEESYVVQGRVFMQVDLEDGLLKSRDAANTGYEFTRTHGVLTLDTRGNEHGDLGIVAVVPVGMWHVASVRMTAVPGTDLTKGSEFGYFQFGGSDIIVLLQAGIEPRVDTDPSPRSMGTIIARC